MTIAQQLKIKDFPFTVKDKGCNEIYYEDSDGYWRKREYDTNSNEIYYENGGGYWRKRQHDTNGKIIYLVDSGGFWYKCEYDIDGNKIYFENSDGVIIDKRPKAIVELTLKDIATKLGISVEQLRIKQ